MVYVGRGKSGRFTPKHCAVRAICSINNIYFCGVNLSREVGGETPELLYCPPSFCRGRGATAILHRGEKLPLLLRMCVGEGGEDMAAKMDGDNAPDSREKEGGRGGLKRFVLSGGLVFHVMAVRGHLLGGQRRRRFVHTPRGQNTISKTKQILNLRLHLCIDSLRRQLSNYLFFLLPFFFPNSRLLSPKRRQKQKQQQ